MLKRHNLVIFIAIGVILLILVSYIFFALKNPGNRNGIPNTTPIPSIISSSPTPKVPVPISMENVPVVPSDKGGGVDTSSQTVNQSKAEIAKLVPHLPYEQNDVKLGTGKTVSILIPSSKYQINPWTLTIQIFGVNYQTVLGDSNYLLMEASFLEASRMAFDWIKSNDANPDRMIISWGDKDYIQQTAEEWLKSQ